MKSKKVFVLNGRDIVSKLGVEIDGIWFTKKRTSVLPRRETGRVFATRTAALAYLGEKPVTRWLARVNVWEGDKVEKVAFYAARDTYVDADGNEIPAGRRELHRTRAAAVKATKKAILSDVASYQRRVDNLRKRAERVK